MLRVASFLIACLLALSARAESADVVRLGALLAGMRSIEATFHQQLKDAKGALVQESGGKVVLAHPGRFRWDTAPPFEQLVVSDGTAVWQYDPDLAQVVVRPLDKRADQVPSMLLAGEVEAVGKLYVITASRDDAGAERFELAPRAEGSPFARLALQFRDGTLERLESAAPSGLGRGQGHR